MLTLRLLNREETEKLYETHMRRDFPPSELKGLSAITSLQRQGRYDVLGTYCADTLIAYALLFKPEGERILLLDYLAVLPEYRNRGNGRATMALLRAYYAHCADALMIECERPKAAPDEREARLRIRFYEGAGAALTNVRIWLFGVEYSILVYPCGNMPQREDWARLMLELYRQMLPEELYIRNVRLIRE